MDSQFAFDFWTHGRFDLSGAQSLRAHRDRLLGGGPMGVLRRKRAGKARGESARERAAPSDSLSGDGEKRKMDMEVNKSRNVIYQRE